MTSVTSAPVERTVETDCKIERKYVFVCGLERSGTTLLASNLARLENCTGFQNTGVLKDEGQYLQNIYRSDPEFGGAGRYGFDQRAHLTEGSDLLTPANIANLREDWHSHWDHSKNICLEKTPGNLIRTRFLQAAFPNAYFVVIRRHPVAVSMATQKWSVTPLHRLFEHWLRCYEFFEQDKRHLKNLYEITYEDYIKEPAWHHQQIADFIGTRASGGDIEEVTGAHNQRYFDRWSRLLNNSLWKSYYRYIGVKYERSFAEYQYSLIKNFRTNEKVLGDTFPSGALCCIAADLGMLPWRIVRKSQWWLERQIRTRLPRWIKHLVNIALRRHERSGQQW